MAHRISTAQVFASTATRCWSTPTQLTRILLRSPTYLAVSVRRIAFLTGTFGRCSRETATAVKAYGS
jgi:hypothetical protein